MKKLLIIKTGTTIAAIRKKYGDFDNHIINQIGIPPSDVIVAPVYDTKSLPQLTDVSAIIITGSHAMVTDKDDWSVSLCSWMRSLDTKRIPVLGICYGHQLIAHAWGGSVDYHPLGKELGTVNIELTNAGMKDALFGVVPDIFLGHVYHAQTVLKLPANARVLAKNEFEPCHAFVIDDHIWGVQFHPEFNEGITRSYIEEQGAKLVQEGYDIDKLRSSVVEHEFGKRLLHRFIQLAE